MDWIHVTLLFLAAVLVCQAHAHYAGGHRDHRDRDDRGIYCNYYQTDPHGVKVVASVLCEDGCCGTIDNQTCCDDGDDDDDDDGGLSGAGRTVTFVLLGVLGMAILASLLSCAFWCYKKANANRRKTCHSDRARSRARAPGVTRHKNVQPTAPVAPPQYSLADHARAQIYNLFTIQSPPPAYADTPPDKPPAYGPAEPPPYTPTPPTGGGGAKDVPGDVTVRSPPPPYA